MTHELGHRQRLKDRFAKCGAEALQDYEMLELFLFNSLPRRDVKPIAKNLIKEFGNLHNVLNANDFELKKVKGVGDKVIFDLKVSKSLVLIAEKGLAEEERVFIGEYPSLIRYLKSLLGNKTSEEMWVVSYDAKGYLIKAQMLFQGSVNSSAVSSREIIKSILLQQAVGVVLCHNHPSGDCTPSPQDLNFTMSFQKALMTVDQNLSLIDHIVVGKNDYYSFQENGKI
ncbi:MAG: DNA repair protein RadC [Proteobacteria bacterium]|nr:DNA repair protein RadC [Pseudomonadota bacterium]